MKSFFQELQLDHYNKWEVKGRTFQKQPEASYNGDRLSCQLNQNEHFIKKNVSKLGL